MTVVDRHRVQQLITLSALERTLQGPERLLREEDVALLLKAAYDDATEASRADFMARVKKYPESEWPWSAVAAGTSKPMGGGNGKVIVAVPQGPKYPATLILIRGQADTAEVDPGNRLPQRGSPEADEWEPLYKAMDAWDTATIQKFVGPSGWRTPGGTTPIEEPTPDQGDTNGAPQDDGNRGPGQAGQNGQNGQNDQSGQNGQPGPIATQPPPGVPRWVWGLAIAGGTVLAVGTGVYLLRGRPRAAERAEEPQGSRLEEILRAQAKVRRQEAESP